MLRQRERLRERLGGDVLAAGDRLQVQAPPKLQIRELAELLKVQDLDVQKLHKGDHHVELTTTKPFVEDRGSLNFLLPRTIWSEPDGAIPWEGGPNRFEISASYSAHSSVTAQGGIGQTIPLFIKDHEFGMALTRITAPGIDWMFFGADFHKI